MAEMNTGVQPCLGSADVTATEWVNRQHRRQLGDNKMVTRQQQAVEYPDGTVVRGPENEFYIVESRGLVSIPADIITKDAEDLGIALPRSLRDATPQLLS